ncbi:glycoside hydrolase family 43 protein [Pedobacter alpinus]|uniref:Glycoside hydrolase family 43 protein n=1 Tax=Pedobacter alpinus TaxID=1590643 RepID=A0ABW5TTK9_9SPHI
MINQIKFKFILFILLFASVSFAQTKLTNPILPGFYPDPSIVRVNDDYYLVNSTFVYFPGIPIMHSKDLINWKQIGNGIERPSQMDFLGEEVSRGLFAPAINYHKGIFYITCTDIDNDGNFVITATNPAGPWSNPVLIPNVRGIDPSLFFDEEKTYIVYNSDAPDNKPLYQGHRTIRMYEFDKENLKTIGKEIQIVNGGVNLAEKPVWIEGPHIFKRNGFYYLSAAEGGTSVNHSQVIFRSKNATGPFIPYENNPILTQRNLDANREKPITSTGHAQLFKGPDGNDYAVFLAVRPYEGNFYNTGRETFIAPVKWTNDWPVINPGFEEVQYSYPVNYPEIQLKGQTPLNGNFNYRYKFENLFNNNFLFLRTHDSSWYKLNKGKITMNLLATTCSEYGNPAFVGRRQQHMKSTVATQMNFKTEKENEKAGLVAFHNQDHYYYICKSSKNGKDVVELYKATPSANKMELMTSETLKKNSKNLQLKITANKDKYAFYYSEKKNKWMLLEDDVDGKFLSTSMAGGFVGTLFGVYATSVGEDSSNKATFNYLEYSGHDK